MKNARLFQLCLRKKLFVRRPNVSGCLSFSLSAGAVSIFALPLTDECLVYRYKVSSLIQCTEGIVFSTARMYRSRYRALFSTGIRLSRCP